MTGHGHPPSPPFTPNVAHVGSDQTPHPPTQNWIPGYEQNPQWPNGSSALQYSQNGIPLLFQQNPAYPSAQDPNAYRTQQNSVPADPLHQDANAQGNQQSNFAVYTISQQDNPNWNQQSLISGSVSAPQERGRGRGRGRNRDRDGRFARQPHSLVNGHQNGHPNNITSLVYHPPGQPRDSRSELCGNQQRIPLWRPPTQPNPLTGIAPDSNLNPLMAGVDSVTQTPELITSTIAKKEPASKDPKFKKPMPTSMVAKRNPAMKSPKPKELTYPLTIIAKMGPLPMESNIPQEYRCCEVCELFGLEYHTICTCGCFPDMSTDMYNYRLNI